MSLEEFLARNEQWATEQLARDKDFFARHAEGQKPRLLWIGCSDSRVPAEQLLKCGPGELFIHRNVANVVAYNDINIAAVIEYAVDALHIEDVVICGHYKCGGVAAACADNIRTGYIGDWLMIISWAKKWVDQRLGLRKQELNQDEYLRLVVEENVRLQVKHLSHLSVIRSAWIKSAKVPRLHGWVYDIATGRVRVLVDGVTGENPLQ
ncbi:MAG: carbonic anhydrase [Planctomycetes bacterium]|nr:carbonic anhydrase [Planctomycetota bacterium]